MVSRERKSSSTSPGRGHLQNDLFTPWAQRGHGPHSLHSKPTRCGRVKWGAATPPGKPSVNKVTSRQSHLRAQVTQVNHMEMKVTAGLE